MVPLYMKYMGAEAYGLVGFFSMVQAWFNVLDLGLTPTIARESARYFGGALAKEDYLRLFRALNLIFFIVALVGGGLLVMLAPLVAERWLHVRELHIREVTTAVQVMGLSVALRWLTGLYRGVITGAERLVWLSLCNAIVASLRFAAVFVSMAVWGFTPKVFFLHQLSIAVLELIILYLEVVSLLPKNVSQNQGIFWSFTPVAPLLRFSLTIALTSLVWVLVTQTDKLILSGILSLSDYGVFTLSVLLASGITLVTGPITTVLLPRLARLYAEGKHDDMIQLYQDFGQLVGVVAISLTVTLVCGADSFLFAWTGDRNLAHSAAPILRLYAVGNGLMALSAFPFYLQYARGDLRYHLIGNIGLVILLIPAIFIAASHAGAIGAGWVWVGINLLYLFGWVAFVHGRLKAGIHLTWIRSSFLNIFLPVFTVAVLMRSLWHEGGQSGRLESFYWVVLMGAIVMVAAGMASPLCREFFLRSEYLAWMSRIQGFKGDSNPK